MVTLLLTIDEGVALRLVLRRSRGDLKVPTREQLHRARSPRRAGPIRPRKDKREEEAGHRDCVKYEVREQNLPLQG